MYRTILVFGFLLCGFFSHSQKTGDTKIVVEVRDTANLRNRVKWAFVELDFIVKDLPGDTLETYPREYLNDAYLIANAVINTTQVVITGLWSTRKVGLWSVSTAPKNWKEVAYYKGCVEWRVLSVVAETIGKEITYGR